MWVLLCLYRLEINVPSMDTEHLLQRKMTLIQQGRLEPQLKTNLQFAISAMDKIPLVLKKNAVLLVEGDQFLLRIYSGKPNLRCAVFQGNDGIIIHHTINFYRELHEDDIHGAFFQGHDCPYDRSCRDQAMNAVYPGREPLELNIICKDLRITFSDPNPVKAIVVPYYK